MVLSYLGCKESLLKHIEKSIPIKSYVLVDLFAGTGSVGKYFSSKATRVIANDVEYYSYVINRALLQCDYSDKLQRIIDDMNAMPLNCTQTLMLDSYAPPARLFFTRENAQKIDTIRQKISKLYNEDDKEYYFLLASLLVSADKVANTTGTYGAYLKTFRKTAQKNLHLTPIHTNTHISGQGNLVYNMDASQVPIDDVGVVVVYLDPPYNKRQYGSNYHVLNYIARYNPNINIHGKGGIITGYTRSKYCSRKWATDTLTNLINDLDVNCIVMSYNNQGIIKDATIRALLEKKGALVVHEIPYKDYNTSVPKNNNIHEYIYQTYSSHK